MKALGLRAHMPEQLIVPLAIGVWCFFTGGLAWAANWLLRYRTRSIRIVGALGFAIAINALLVAVFSVDWSLPETPASGPQIPINPFNPPLGSRSQPGRVESPAAVVRGQVAELLPGFVVFNPPTKMVVGQHEQVTVRITRSLAENTIKERLQGRGEPQIEQVKVGTFMRVRLFGDGFKVSTHSDESQAVADNDFAEWLYDVLPTESGKKLLTLQIAIRFKLANSEEITNLPVLTRDIAVQVNPWWSTKTFVADNWQWFFGGIGGILVSIGGFFGKRWFARNSDGNRAAGFES